MWSIWVSSLWIMQDLQEEVTSDSSVQLPSAVDR